MHHEVTFAPGISECIRHQCANVIILTEARANAARHQEICSQKESPEEILEHVTAQSFD